MARDTMTYESYEPDSFDNPPKGPVGVLTVALVR